MSNMIIGDLTINEMIEEFGKMSKDEIKLEAFAQSAVLMDFVEKAGGPNADEMYIKSLIIMIKAACGADGVLAYDEKLLMDAILLDSFEPEAADAITELIRGDADESMYEAIKILADQILIAGLEGMYAAIAMARLMMCFIAIDGKIDRSEISAIKKMFTETYEKAGIIAILSMMEEEK